MTPTRRNKMIRTLYWSGWEYEDIRQFMNCKSLSDRTMKKITKDKWPKSNV